MENELEYLKIFLCDYANRRNAILEKNFIINWKSKVNNFYDIENQEEPILETYDSIEICLDAQFILVHHKAILATHLKVMGKKCASYRPKVVTREESEVFDLEHFKESQYFNEILTKTKITYEKLLEKGQKLYTKWERNNCEDNQYKIKQFFETKDNYLDLKIDFLNNTIDMRSCHFSTFGDTPIDSILIVDQEEQADLEEKGDNYDKLLSLVNDNKILKIENGYIINNKYYKTIEEYFEEI